MKYFVVDKDTLQVIAVCREMAAAHAVCDALNAPLHNDRYFIVTY